MTYEEAVELAEAEIEYVTKYNDFSDPDIREIYYAYTGTLNNDRAKFVKLFAEHIQLKHSPLMEALK